MSTVIPPVASSASSAAAVAPRAAHAAPRDTRPVMSRLLKIGPWLLLALLIALPWIAPALGQDYYVGFVRRALIFMLAVAGLNFILGYGGMVALGQAGFIGVGAYTLVAMSDAGVTSAWAMWGAAAVVAGLVSAFVGLVSLRTRGAYFIMITLAFAQMIYYVSVSVNAYGGDDGYNLPQRPALGFGLDSANDATLYWVVLAIVAILFVGLNRMTRSRFGHALVGTRDNETRMLALGYPVFAIQLVAFVIAGALAGLAGALLVTHNSFVSPSVINWTQSATMIVMVLLGGVGRRWGGPIGAGVWIALEELFRGYTEYWHWPLGALLIFLVFFAPRGIAALADVRAKRSFAREAPASAAASPAVSPAASSKVTS